MSSLRREKLNHYRNRSIGFVFQFYHLLPELSVLENALLAGLIPRRIGKALQPLFALIVGLVHRSGSGLVARSGGASGGR